MPEYDDNDVWGGEVEIMTAREKEIIKNNLRAFRNNFGDVRIVKENDVFYVYSPVERDTWVQACYNIHYLNGWLYGCVQGALKCVKLKEDEV